MDLLWHLEIKIYQKRHSLALEKPKLFQRASSGSLNNMFLWAKVCRSISKPLAMLRLEFEHVRFHWVVFFGK